MIKIQKLEEGEYAPYAIMYIDLLPDDSLVLQHLQDNLKTIQTFIPSLNSSQICLILKSIPKFG